MKTVLFFSIVILLSSCSKKDSETKHESVLIDLTDEKAVRVNSSDIKRIAQPSSEEDGVSFSLKYIDNREFGGMESIVLPEANLGVFYDRLTRIEMMKRYNAHLDTLLKPLDTISYGYNQSNVFAQVLGEMTRLSKVKDGERTLHVYSDLQENSSYFSLQNRVQMKMLDDKDKLVEYFLAQFDISDDAKLSGVTLAIHHKPVMRGEHQFKQFLVLYTEIFEEKLGAKVEHVRISLNSIAYEN